MDGPRTEAAARAAPEVRSKVRRSIGFMVGSLVGGGLSGPVFRILRSRFTFNEPLALLLAWRDVAKMLWYRVRCKALLDRRTV